MKRENFNWDKYIATASYQEVMDNSPFPSNRPPTLYNPDHTLLYLPSLDLDVATDDFNELKIMLDGVIDNYRRYQELNDKFKMARARIDCIELCQLIQDCGPTPEIYIDPDPLLG